MHVLAFDEFRIGCSTDRGVVDITSLAPRDAAPAERMVALIEGWEELRPTVEAAVTEASSHLPLESIRLLPPLRPPKIVAAPANYRAHTDEMVGLVGTQVIEQFKGFLKAPSSVIGPNGVVRLPYAERRTDYEGELAVVIGRRAKNVAAADALYYVFGYMPLLDMTIRGDEDRSFRKSVDTFTPIGPAIATRDEAPDPGSLGLKLWLNGELRQDANTRDLVWDIPKLIATYSEVMTLDPGDVIATGTPAGVGDVAPGDEIKVQIDRVGTLEVSVAAGWSY